MSIAALLNSMDDASARIALTNCCASTTWVNGMRAGRPYQDDEALNRMFGAVNWEMQTDDWLEAFQAHPMIGDVDSLREQFASTKRLAAVEQAGVAAASEATLAELAELNRRYYERFGFIFIVFATGKSADEMLAILKRRIRNSKKGELRNAAIEQIKIAWRRLEQLAPAADNP